MKISVLGIGYVGAVSAACLAKDGNEVIAVDPNAEKVGAILAGQSPILETGLGEAILDAVRTGCLTATSDTADAVLRTDLSIICVGTPSRTNGSLDLSYVLRAAEEVGAALKQKSARHTVVVRSTVLPGTMEELVIPAVERASGLKAGEDFGAGYYPEFLRESTALADYYNPGTIVLGEFPGDAGSTEQLKSLCEHLPVEPIVIPIRAAEAVKYTNNAWHALKISFANEIGNICKAAEVDSFQVMEVLCSDTRLNISPVYLKPGFAFGGSCLPKDLRALRYRARELDVPTPVLDATLAANENQLAKAFEMIARSGARKVGMIGLSFKSGTDDLRESPLVELAERLHGKGFDLRIFDPDVTYSNLMGANLHFIRSHIPHLSTLMVDDVDALIAHGEAIVVGKRDGSTARILDALDGEKAVIDLVRVAHPNVSPGKYQGLCW